MPRKGAQAKAFAAQQAKKREAEKQEARAKVDAEKNNAKGISECRDVGQLMRMHRANSERIEHMEEAQEKEAKRKEAERAAKEKELEESQGKSWWDKFLPKPKGPREATSPNKVQQQRDNIEQFYDLLKCSKHVKREIQAVFKAFDANKDGSLNINEFRTYLKEPKERMPFLNRIFLTMDNDAMDGAERVNTYGVGELDMFEFFVLTQCPLSRVEVGYYSICSLPRGDYAIRFIWDLYDPRRTGEIDSDTFRCMIREGMSAMLPDYLVRGDEPLPPAVTEQLEKIRKEQGEELWTKLRYGDVAVRTDGNGERHLAIVKDHTDYSVTVQDIYSLENAMGWTQGDDNTFTYHMNRHVVHERVAPPLPGDDLFDEALEKFMFLSADNDGDGSITLKEFRHFIRRRVACGEPSPYAAFLAFQKKLRSVGGLGDSFWDARTLDLAVTLEKHGLWSAWELHRHFNLGKVCKRPPPKKGGEPPLLPPEKGKNDGPVDTLNVKPPPLPKKPRKKALKGEDLIDQAQEIDFAAMVAASGEEVVAGFFLDFEAVRTVSSEYDAPRRSGPNVEQLVAENARRVVRDKQAQGATLTVVLQKAKGLQRVNGLLEGPRPDVFVTVEVENEELFTSPLRYETINPNWTTEEDGKIEGHAFDPCGVPEKLQFRVWDRISDKERRALGFALIRRKRLWDVCTTKNRTVGLQVIGRIGGTEIQATGELWVELRWEPRPFDPALNIDSSPDKWRPPTPEESRPETPITDDESETSEMRAMRELEEQLAEQERLLTPVLKLKKPDFEYKPLPPISDGMIRKPSQICACGFSCQLEVDFLRHCLECEMREGDTVDLLLLMRTLDPEVERKEAAIREKAAAPAPSPINVLTLEAATPSKKKRKKKKHVADAPAPAARMGRESYDAYPAEILTLEDIPGRPESAGLRLDGSALRSPFLNARPGSSRPGSRGGYGSRPGTANSDKSVTWKLPSLPAVNQSELGEVEDPQAFPAPLVNKDDGVKPRKKGWFGRRSRAVTPPGL